ncbi:MAG: cell envelope protein SmpA [Rhodobacterales bacterium]|nr:MAG: cell envelope protein SmpA [Rhodobacterales bacterium]
MAIKTRVRMLVMGISLCAVAACSAVYRNHGYVPSDEELSDITVGVDSRATVEEIMGASSAGSVLSGDDIYYVRSRVKHLGMFRPEVVERQVVAISFDDADVVQNIERFSLADGRIVRLERRVTSSSVEGKGFLRQLLGNLGSFDPRTMLGSG